MRSIAIALSFGALATAATYAAARTGTAPAMQAGTLTCVTNPNVGLVFGTTRAAACTFVSDSGERREYGALFPRAGRDRDVTRSETLSWRVMTSDGSLRSSQLDGPFAAAPAATVPAFQAAARAVRLEPVRQEGEPGLNFADPAPRLLLGAVEGQQ